MAFLESELGEATVITICSHKRRYDPDITAIHHHSLLSCSVESGFTYGDRDAVTETVSSALTQDRGLGDRPLLRLGRGAIDLKKENYLFNGLPTLQ